MWLIRLPRRVYNWTFKNVTYLILLVLLSLIVWLTLHYFEKEQLTYIISVLGITFALFQFLYNHIATKKRQMYELRYGAYKDMVKLIESFSDFLIESTAKQKIIAPTEVHFLVKSQLNRLDSALIEYNNFLFPKLLEAKETTVLTELFKQVSVETYRYRIEVTKNELNHTASIDNFEEFSYWFGEMLIISNELNENKYHFYKKLTTYF